ncbi:beta-N-acetylhexosaminidase [Pedobacter antarcticus]|uniref:beta-N-acetylhexosaminidase n=2 Tax=Pedobacter antarcticus TaxID=34086 RepID=A0A081PD54_9SPHI|nr:beta-N-acetylhexosaminidase [Pedobacter antarcticus]KEQ28627.1 beta-N-acetylhexosaminidase [Pedobacter antarcticus 4BY]SDL71161.1 hexosaminidase [Pedobacter antarcticus]SFE87214.1 hexosaminidase [Pedobacter antarcticus]
MKRYFLSFLLTIYSCCILAQQPAIIPQPVSIQVQGNMPGFQLQDGTELFAADSLVRSSAFLSAYLKRYHQLNLKPAAAEQNDDVSRIILEVGNIPGAFEDQYQLQVQPKVIHIRGNSAKAVFYGVQTLIQLFPPVDSAEISIPAVEIIDYPRFKYRGMHLDVSRHFFDITFVKQYIDYLALHKLNYFHWHLTDDHGWRIAIDQYPKLTEVGAWRDGTIIGLYPGTGNDGIRYGGFYTKDEIKEVIRYAEDRYITVVPEIEMPGHAMSILAAYPEFGTNPGTKTRVAQTWGIFNKFNNVLQPTDQTFKFLENVLGEVIELFPGPYIHIGGDECAKIWWKQSALSNRIVQQNGLKDMNGLQSYFVNRISKYLASKGKKMIGWDEILDGGLAPDAIVMSWRGEAGGIAAAKKKHQVIMTPEMKTYFNHAQFLKEDSLTAAKLTTLETVYNYDPIPVGLNPADAAYIIGGQGNLWSEYISNPAKAEYQLFPRLDALSEVLWSPKEQRNYTDFQLRLKTQLKRYELMEINFNKKYLK